MKELIASYRKMFELLKLNLPIWLIKINVMVRVRSNDLYTTLQVQLAITSVWKVQFQLFQHFSVAYTEHFHMICSILK